MTFSEWLLTPIPWIFLAAIVIGFVVDFLLERNERIRVERDARIAERRNRLRHESNTQR